MSHSKRGILGGTLMAAGWLLLALWLVPRVRDFVAGAYASGLSPNLSKLWPLPAPQLAGALAVIACFSAGLVLAAVWSHRGGGLSRIVEERLQSPRRLALTIAVLAALISATVLAYGEPTIADAKTHVSRAWIWTRSLRAGEIPVWTDLWYGGFLIGQHYSPLSHVIPAALGLLGIPVPLAVKLIVWLAGVSGAVGFGMWCRSFHRSPQAGLLGGFIYSLLPAIAAAWMWQGRLPGAVLTGILPWAFVAVHRLGGRDGGRRTAAGLALSLGAIVLTQTVEAELAFAMIAAYSLVEIAARRGGHLKWLLIAWSWGLAISLCFVIPVYLERGFVNEIAPPPVVLPGGAPMLAEIVRRALRWSFRGDWYPGLTVLALAGIGAWNVVGAMRRHERVRDALAMLALILVPLAYVRLARHYPEQFFVGTALIAASSVTRAYGWRRSRLLPAAMLLLLIDLGPANLISTYVTHRGSKEAAYGTIEARQGAGSYLEIPLGPGGVPRSSYWHYVPLRPVACVSGPFIQGAPRSFAYRAAMIDSVAGALAAGKAPDERLMAFLSFENVGMIAVSTPTAISPPASPVPRGAELDPVAPVWRVVDVSPVSVLDSIPAFRLPEPPVTAALGIGTDRPGDRPASRMVIDEAYAWMKAARPTAVAGVRLARRPNAVELHVPDVGERTLRIALAPYPITTVRIDGSPADWRADAVGGILVDVPSGPHVISVGCRIAAIRRTLGILLAAFMIAAFLAVVFGSRPERGAHRA